MLPAMVSKVCFRLFLCYFSSRRHCDQGGGPSISEGQSLPGAGSQSLPELLSKLSI